MYTFEKSILGNQKTLDGKIRLSAILSFCQEIAIEHADKMSVDNANIGKNVCWILNRITAILSENKCQSKTVTVNTFPCIGKGVTYPRQYTIFDEQTELARVSSDWSVLDMETRRIARVGELQGYNEYCQEPMLDALNMPKERAKVVLQENFVGEFIVRRSNIDEVGHMNNTCYADIVWDMLDDNTVSRGIKTFNITFIKEALLGETLKLYRQFEENSVIIQGVKEDGNNCFVAKVERCSKIGEL